MSKKKIVLGIVSVFVLFGFIGAMSEPEGSTQANSQDQKDKPQAVKQSPKDKMRDQLNQMVSNNTIFKPGSYVKGDIPAGEYVFMPMNDGSSYYSEEDQAGNIIDNENFDSFGYVYVHGAGNVSVGGSLIPIAALSQLSVDSPREVYEILKEKKDYMDAGFYKIGVDLPAGTYTIQSYGSGYVSVTSGPIGKSEIIDNEIVNGKYTVSVKNGQYLKVSRGFIVESK